MYILTPDVQLSGLGGKAPDVLSVRIWQILYVQHSGSFCSSSTAAGAFLPVYFPLQTFTFGPMSWEGFLADYKPSISMQMKMQIGLDETSWTAVEVKDLI